MEKETGQQRIDIYCMLSDVLRDLWVAVFIGISAAFLVYVGAKLMYHPTYTSRTTFVVSAKGSSNGAYTNMSKTQKLTSVFQSVLNSQVLKKRAAENLGLDSFPGTVDISVVPETNLLTVSVTAESPELALRLLNNMLDTYPEVGKNVLGEVVMEVFEAPGYPSVPDQGFQGRRLMKKAFLIGCLCMMAVLALVSYLKDTVKNEREVPEKLDTTVFAVLYHERKYKNVKDFLKRKKKRILLTEPAVSFGYREMMKRVRTKLLYQMKKTGLKVVVVTSAAPGEGKTTFAMNLAQAMAQNGRKILLIEGNLKNPGLAQCMGVDQSAYSDWSGFFPKGKELTDGIFEPEGFAFQAMLNHTAVGRGTELLASGKMQRFMEAMRQEMDLIIIDAALARKRSDTEVLARLSDASFLVVKQNMTPTKYINDTIDMLNNYGNGVLGCIFNDVMRGNEVFSSGYGYGYGYGYGSYGRYGRYGKYGKYGRYGRYGRYAGYGSYYNPYEEAVKKESKDE